MSAITLSALKDVEGQGQEKDAPGSDTPPNVSTTSHVPGHLRMRTNTAEIDSTITHPGSVKINVKGAFIVDQENGSPNGSTAPAITVAVNGGSHDTKDIRLPNHTAVVSHIAVDVSIPPLPYIGIDINHRACQRMHS